MGDPICMIVSVSRSSFAPAVVTRDTGDESDVTGNRWVVDRDLSVADDGGNSRVMITCIHDAIA